MKKRVNSSSSYTNHEGSGSTIALLPTGPSTTDLIVDSVADGTETVFYMKSDSQYMHFEGRYNSSGTTITVLNILTSSNGGGSVNWTSGQKVVVTSFSGDDFENIDLMLYTESQGVNRKAETRRKLGILDSFESKPDVDPMVVVAFGDSNTHGAFAVDNAGYTQNLRVREWAGSDASNSLDDAAWKTVNPDGAYNDLGSATRALGYCQGQRGNAVITMVYEIQEVRGCDVFLIMVAGGGAGSDKYDPALGLTPSADNLWEYLCTSVNDALAALAAGTNGAPYAFDAGTVDVVWLGTGAGDVVSSTFPLPKPYPDPSIGEDYLSRTTDLIAEIEDSSSSVGGGWAEQFKTIYVVPSTPTPRDYFKAFDGHERLMNVTGDNVRYIPAAEDYPMQDPWHWATAGIKQLGKDGSRAVLAGAGAKTQNQKLAALLDWASGAKSTVADGGNAFDFDTVEELLTGTLLRLLNAGAVRLTIAPDGTITAVSNVNVGGDLTVEGEATVEGAFEAEGDCLLGGVINTRRDFFGLIEVIGFERVAMYFQGFSVVGGNMTAALPTSAPAEANTFWRDGNDLKIT